MATPTLRVPLRGAHQDRAIEEIMARTNLLVEYGTGTGKSRVYVDTIKLITDEGEGPVLVLVPNSLLDQTYDEFTRWSGFPWTASFVRILDGSMTLERRADWLRTSSAPVMVLSHEAMSQKKIREALLSRTWAAVFLDEASRFRNDSERTKTLRFLGRRTDTRYALTGNLTVRNPADCWYVMNWLDPGLFGMTGRRTFLTEYCLLGGYTGMEPYALRPDKIKKFRAILDAHRITCELRDIREMPERTLSLRMVDLVGRQKAAYEQMREELFVEISRMTGPAFESEASTYAVRLLRLQEIAAGFSRNIEGDVEYLPSPKTKEMIDLIMDDPESPTVIWWWWQPEKTVIERELAAHGLPYITLGEPDAVARFMNGGVPILTAQMARGGYGLNLTRATRMFFHCLPWDLDVYSQAQERNMRLTTTAPSLEVVHLVARRSVDEYVRGKLLDKAGMSRTLTRSAALEMLRR